MKQILTPSEAASQCGAEEHFYTMFRWRVHPIAEQIAGLHGECGRLCSLRFCRQRSRKRAGDANESMRDLLAEMIDGAWFLAASEPESLTLTRSGDAQSFFGILGFQNGVVAELELNHGCPDSMPDLCTLKANFSGGHVTNQPLAGYFNFEGMLLATEEGCRFPILENNGFEPVEGMIELMDQRFRFAVEHGTFPAGALQACRIMTLIGEAWQ